MESFSGYARFLAPVFVAAAGLCGGCSDSKGSDASGMAASAATAGGAVAGIASPAAASSGSPNAAATGCAAPASAGIYGEIAAGRGVLSGTEFTEDPAQPLEFVEVRYALDDPSPMPAPTAMPSPLSSPEPPLTVTRYYGTYTVPAFQGIQAPESQSNPGAAYAANATTGCFSIVLERGANGQSEANSSDASQSPGNAALSGDLPSRGPGGLHPAATVDMGPITTFTISNLGKDSGTGSFQFLSGSTVVNGTVTIVGSTTTLIR